MQGYNSTAPIYLSNFKKSPFVKEVGLFSVKESLDNSYWAAEDGVYKFEFLTGDGIVSNSSAPMYFQLIRYTPNYSYESFELTIQGMVNTDGTIEYGGGRLGVLKDSSIIWEDGEVWNKVDRIKIPPKENSVLNLQDIKANAIRNSQAFGNLYNNTYLY